MYRIISASSLQLAYITRVNKVTITTSDAYQNFSTQKPFILPTILILAQTFLLRQP